MIIHVNDVGSGPVDGIRYDPIDVAPDITQEQAVAAAMAWIGPPLASQAARIETRSVLFTNEQWVERDAAGNSHLVLQRVPAWVVTFSGIDFPLVGGGDIPSPGSTTPSFNHEANVVIDARTGEYLMQFSYR